MKKSDLAFYDYNLIFVTKPGKFKLWMGHDSNAELCKEFVIWFFEEEIKCLIILV